MEKDPNELTNLYGKPEMKEVTASLKNQLLDLQKEYNLEEMMRKTDARIKRAYHKGF